jgi:hypothetical protein
VSVTWKQRVSYPVEYENCHKYGISVANLDYCRALVPVTRQHPAFRNETLVDFSSKLSHGARSNNPIMILQFLLILGELLS